MRDSTSTGRLRIVVPSGTILYHFNTQQKTDLKQKLIEMRPFKPKSTFVWLLKKKKKKSSILWGVKLRTFSCLEGEIWAHMIR